MNKILHILLVLLFSLTIISCGSDDGGSSASTDNSSSTTTSDDITTSDTTTPTVYSISPTDNQTGVSVTDNVSVTFSEAMDTTSITTNTSNTTCSGSFQLSADNFSSCFQMSSTPTSSNSDKTFTIDPFDNLTKGTTFKFKFTTGLKDSAGNSLSSEYESSNGFTTWNGTQQLGTSSEDYATSIFIDNSTGDIVISGNTQGSLDGYTNAGNYDSFIQKFNSSGIKQWTKQFGTSADEYTNDIVIDSSGNIYMTGYTTGNLDNNSNSGDADIFTSKYNSSGTRQWTKLLGTSNGNLSYAIGLDSSNNAYLTGWSRGGLDNNTNSGDYDAFLLKYNESGTKQWTKLLGTSSEDGGRDIIVDSSDNIFILGTTKGNIDGASSASSFSDTFVAKYNSSGTRQWIKQFGTSDSSSEGKCFAIDSVGNLFISGKTGGAFDGYTNAGRSDVFIAKYNSSGTKQWIKQFGTSEYDYSNTCDVDTLDNFYIGGYTTDGAFDDYSNLGNNDLIISKYNSSGTKQWLKQFGTSNYEYDDCGVILDSSNNILMCGKLDARGSGEGLDGNSHLGGSTGSSDYFLIKFNSDGIKF